MNHQFSIDVLLQTWNVIPTNVGDSVSAKMTLLAVLRYSCFHLGISLPIFKSLAVMMLVGVSTHQPASLILTHLVTVGLKLHKMVVTISRLVQYGCYISALVHTQGSNY